MLNALYERITMVFLLTFSIIYSSSSYSNIEIELEEKYDEYVSQIIQNSRIDLTGPHSASKNAFTPSIKALWDGLESEQNTNAFHALKKMDRDSFQIKDQIFLYILNKMKLQKEDITFLNFLSQEKLTTESIHRILSYKHYFPKYFVKHLKRKYSKITSNYNQIVNDTKNITRRELQELFYNHPDFSNYRNGKYESSIKLFMFCRKKRNQKCMLLMKDKMNNIVKDLNNQTWHQPSLGMSRKGYPFNKVNGDTPSGVYLINGVMPEANRQKVFGKNRRLIINFPRKSIEDSELKKLLPLSSHDKQWWKQGVIARNMGRGLFRIHGTGFKNRKKSSSHYPFFPTSGCIAQREKKYKGVNYNDQRLLLDKLMESLELPISFSNERKIKGILYVIELDSAEEAVSFEEIKNILDLKD